ncbi:type I secretion system permease/ATPase [Microvirga arsenatis]|uniref:Type I secretion system permease/ATPase n=1 Tax=Microvirga arsenatis TaxID=2692265 RepID=A0ABW9YSR7_9HYPH|nr:type I secretion system permease/ATPase [Microvirga arsenatis]NBJ11593.1 type I secretion system permease/ATPase [Microvirga arsenatis]NBJ22802.1 type I secretion system permease/ATPase [Microvirga arsenatis]
MSKKPGETIVAEALRHCRAHFAYALGFNVFINILLLAYPIFMIQVYERVLSSRSIETLIVLSTGLVIALIFKAVFQWARGALFVRAAVRLDRLLADRILTALIERNAGGTSSEGSQALRDLDSFRQFATGKGALAAIDAPWAILFAGVLLILDLQVGLVSLACILLMAVATIANTALTKRAIAESSQYSNKSYGFAEANLRGSEAIVAMGMVGSVVGKWRHLRNPGLDTQVKTSQVGVLFNAILGSARILVQAVIMMAGVIEILYSDAPTGMLFAALIVAGFAMKPIDQLVAAWDDYIPARQALKRIEALLSETPRSRAGTALPKPQGHLTCYNLYYIPPGGEQPILSNVNLAIRPGESLGLIGLNGSGKTTLARLLVGNLKPTRGQLRLDGVELWSASREDIGRHIGYLPQSISILSGTVAENIGRFGKLSDEEVVAAAKAAGVHDMILRLPKGYDTEIGENGHPLSGGQRQLIALARAIAGSPALVVLDEPNSNLDGQAEEALVACIAGLKQRGITCVLITHRPTLVRDLDHAVVLKDGHVVSAGATENVFKRLGRPVVVRNASGNGEEVAQ